MASTRVLSCDFVHRDRQEYYEVLIPAALFVRSIARQWLIVSGRLERERLLAVFTPRELEVLQLLAQGLDTDHMAHSLASPHALLSGTFTT